MEKGTCRHGEFDLLEGCPECIRERKEEAEINSPANIAERIRIANIPAGQEELTLTSVDPGAWHTGEEEVRTVTPSDPQTAMIVINPGQDLRVTALYQEGCRLYEFAEARIIKNNEDMKPATDDQAIVTQTRKAIEEIRKGYANPIRGHLDAVNAAFKEFTDPLVKADTINRQKMTAYLVEVKRKAAEAEAINRAKIELARREAEHSGTGEFTVDTTPVEVTQAPRLTRTDMGSSGLAANWKWEVVDRSLVPDAYLVVDAAMLSAIAKKHHDQKPVPGIRFYNEPGLRVYTK